MKLLEDAVAAGAEVIKQQGEAGLDKTHPFASRILTRNGWVTNRYTVHTSYMWLSAIEHSAEHFGQLVVYYRANNLIPPESRR